MSVTKPYQSPFRVTYDDLITVSENRLKWLSTANKGGWTVQHEIQVQKKLIALLKKFKKDPQIDLFEEFKKTK